MQTVGQMEQLGKVKPLGEGSYGQVQIFKTPLYPNAVLKSGRQGHLAREASMMASLRHPHIARVMAKVIPPVDPNQPGYLLLENLGLPLRHKNDMARYVMK